MSARRQGNSGDLPGAGSVDGGGVPDHRSVTLIGMPGSGKSVVGRIIAARLGWTFVDTDRLIERRHGDPLQALIDRVGEARFRQLEEEAVLALPAAERTVIATGGSVVYSEPAMAHLASISTIVFLDAALDTIRQHIRSQRPRGIVGLTEGGIEALYRERLPLYRRHAAIAIATGTESETPEQAADRVLSALAGPPATP